MTRAEARGDIPAISARISHRCTAFTVLVISRWVLPGGTGSHGTLVNCVHLLHVKVEGTGHWLPAPGRTLASPTNHHHRIANPVLRMESTRGTKTVNLTLGAKSSLEKIYFHL